MLVFFSSRTCVHLGELPREWWFAHLGTARSNNAVPHLSSRITACLNNSSPCIDFQFHTKVQTPRCLSFVATSLRGVVKKHLFSRSEVWSAGRSRHSAGHNQLLNRTRLPPSLPTQLLEMANTSSPCIHASELVVTEDIITLPGRHPLEGVLNFHFPRIASNTTCETDRFRHFQPSLVLPYNPLRISRVFLLCIFLVLLACVSPVYRSSYAGQNGNGNDPERPASGRCNPGTADGFSASDLLEKGYHPLGPHGSKRKRDSDPPQPSKSISRKKGARSFACPFYLRDRLQHSDCLNKRLKRLSDVRQHLLERAHYQVVHCPVCGVTFSGSIGEARRRRDVHVQAADCEPLPSPPNYPGITEDQERRIREIARNTRTNQFNQVQRWFEIWDFLFPGEERPDTPFLDDPPDIQRVVDWRNVIFGNNLWRELLNEPWTTAMQPEDQRSGMLNFIESFIAQARALVGQDAGPEEDDHQADNSTYIDANTPAPSGTTADRRRVVSVGSDSNPPADAPRQAYLSPNSFTGSGQAPHAHVHGQMDPTAGNLPAVPSVRRVPPAVVPPAVRPMPPQIDPALDVPQHIDAAGPGDTTDFHDPTLPDFALDGYPLQMDYFGVDFGSDWQDPVLHNDYGRSDGNQSPEGQDAVGGRQ